MVIDVALEVDTRGDELVVVKTALSEEAGERLRRERDRLEASRHPGVVELVSSTDDPVTLTFAWAGGRSLETARPQLGRAVRLLVAVCSTVADLHDLGIVHGRIEPSHVVVDSQERPRLCGMAGPDPHEPEPAPADDVAGLGLLIATLAGRGDDLEPIPELRWRRRRWDGYLRGALQTLADQATDPDPAHRPTARSLARSLDELVPDDGDGAPPAHAALAGPGGAGGRRTLVAGGVAMAVILLLVAMARQPRPTDPRAGEVAAGDVAASDPPSTSTTTAPRAVDAGLATSSTVTAARSCPPVSGAAADIDGDGCVDPVQVSAGEVRTAGARYRIGEPGDRVAIGDWDCDGRATPALLRPRTGEVFVFDGWATTSSALTVPAATTVRGAREVVAPTPGRCGPPQIRRTDGTTTTLSERGSEP